MKKRKEKGKINQKIKNEKKRKLLTCDHGGRQVDVDGHCEYFPLWCSTKKVLQIGS